MLVTSYLGAFLYKIILTNHILQLQIWDRRRDNPMKQISIHYGPAYCCAWHPEHEHWIMSAGRDKMIKVGTYVTVDWNSCKLHANTLNP